MAEWQVSHVAMESTGVYGKPVWNILEGHVELLLGNARHLKIVPGRKTDVKDCEWIAQLLQYGLLGPVLPSPEVRQWRDLTGIGPSASINTGRWSIGSTRRLKMPSPSTAQRHYGVFKRRMLGRWRREDDVMLAALGHE
jgi:hypothetical protein